MASPDSNPFTPPPPAGQPEKVADTPLPRLGVGHLMLWAFCTAIYLSLVRAMDWLQGSPPDSAIMLRVSNIAYGIVTGANQAAALVLLYARVRSGGDLIRHPGHWLVIVTTVFSLVAWPIYLVLLALDDIAFFDSIFYLIYGWFFLVPVVGYSLAFTHTTQPRWKAFWVVAVTANAAEVLFYSTEWFQLMTGAEVGSLLHDWSRIIVAVWITVVAALDWRADQKRDWLHWVGVTTRILYGLLFAFVTFVLR